MPNTQAKYKVRLTPECRAELEALCRQQSVAAAKHRRARILLLSDEDHPDGRRRDWEIAEAVGLSERQVVRVRQQFVRDGEAALGRKPRPPAPGKLDGAAQARLVTLCCSTPPHGRDRWTLRLLCDELARLAVVTTVCRETVRRCLKETSSSRGGTSATASRRRAGRGSSPGWKPSSTSTRSPTTRAAR